MFRLVIWKDLKYPTENNEIIDFTGYYKVSNYGMIKTVKRVYYCGHRGQQASILPESLISFQISKKGYYITRLTNGNKRFGITAGRAVAYAFQEYCGEYFDNAQVNHKDENKQNNCAENLEWCTAKYNCNYGTHNERVSKANRGKKQSEETKKKISIANSGKNNGMYGKIPVKPFVKGHIPWNKGKKWSEEVKEKLRKPHKKSTQ